MARSLILSLTQTISPLALPVRSRSRTRPPSTLSLVSLYRSLSASLPRRRRQHTRLHPSRSSLPLSLSRLSFSLGSHPGPKVSPPSAPAQTKHSASSPPYAPAQTTHSSLTLSKTQPPLSALLRRLPRTQPAAATDEASPSHDARDLSALCARSRRPLPNPCSQTARCSSPTLPLTASRMDMSFKDARKLWSGIWHKEELVNKKRRWLMQLPSQETNEVGLKKFKKQKSLLNSFLPESFVRRDEVSPQAVKINVERSYKSLCYTERLHEAHNYMALYDVQILQSYFRESSNLMKFHSTLDLLSNNALGLLANLVSEDKITFERNRLRMKKIIKDHFPNILSASNNGKLLATLRQLFEILSNPRNYHEKQPGFLTPASPSTIRSIYTALEALDSMPIFALCSLNRKLIGKKVVPRFPPSKIGYNKKEFINRIRRKCQELILTLNKENSIPEELVKALSIIHLYFKYKPICSGTLTTKFFPFSIETVILQNDIIKALWSLPKVTSNEMKALQSILGLELGDDSSSFLHDLKQYLLQYLFECEEIDIPSDVSDVLAILNRSSCSQPQICLKETVEVETEAVLNVTIELKQIVSYLDSYGSPDEKAAEGLESEDDTENNDFELVENDYCSNHIKYQQQQKNVFSINSELESTGDSMPGTYFISTTSDSCSDIPLSEAPKSNRHGFVKKLKENQDDIYDLKPHYKESTETFLQCTPASYDCIDNSIKELCDETSLVSYRLIGHMLNSFLLIEGHDVGVATRYHLTGEASSSITFQDKENMLDASGENVGIKVLMHSIKDLLPSIPTRCTQSVKKLMKQL